ncbi:hypothetical protein BD413DRAFT_67141 [Trametes elegans]|nr:hypothetical protein BD413DRAFT_67141 [Trametes elegans]
MRKIEETSRRVLSSRNPSALPLLSAFVSGYLTPSRVINIQAMPRRPTTEEILNISERVVDIFQSYGLRSCLFGSAACNLFGVSRTPNDVDVVVLTERYDQEELKELLVNNDDDFYLVNSRNPNADYRVLWYRLPGRAGGRRRKCKVDLLLPGVLNIPFVPRRRVKVISGLPVMPLVPLLLLKLQGWSDHRESHREDMQEKQYVDVDDISELLDIAVERGQSIWQNNLSWVPRDFLDDAQDRVVDYIEEYPDSADSWEELGFYV